MKLPRSAAEGAAGAVWGSEAREAARNAYFELLRQLQGAVRAVILSATAGNSCVRCSDSSCIQLFRLIRSCLLAGCRRFETADAAGDDVLLLLMLPEFTGVFGRDLDFVAYLCTAKSTASFSRQLFADTDRAEHFYLECAIMRDEELHLAFVSSLLALEPVTFRPDAAELAQLCLTASLNDLRLVPVVWHQRRDPSKPARAVPTMDLGKLVAQTLGGRNMAGSASLFSAFIQRRPAAAPPSQAARAVSSTAPAGPSAAAKVAELVLPGGKRPGHAAAEPADLGLCSSSALDRMAVPSTPGHDRQSASRPGELPPGAAELDFGADTTDPPETGQALRKLSADTTPDVTGDVGDAASSPCADLQTVRQQLQLALIRAGQLESQANCLVLEDAVEGHGGSEEAECKAAAVLATADLQLAASCPSVIDMAADDDDDDLPEGGGKWNAAENSTAAPSEGEADVTDALDKSREYDVDISRVKELLGNTAGIGYRASKSLDNIVPAHASWGSIVRGFDEGDDWLRVGDYYLPMLLRGEPVLIPRPEGEKLYVADVTRVQELLGNTQGLGYRLSKSLDDRDDNQAVAWGRSVRGVDEGDGWLRVGERFLPLTLHGEAVLDAQAPAPTVVTINAMATVQVGQQATDVLLNIFRWDAQDLDAEGAAAEWYAADFAADLSDAFGLHISDPACWEPLPQVVLSLEDLKELQELAARRIEAMGGQSAATAAALKAAARTHAAARDAERMSKARLRRRLPLGVAPLRLDDLYPAPSPSLPSRAQPDSAKRGGDGDDEASTSSAILGGAGCGGISEEEDEDEACDAVAALEGLWESSRVEGARSLLRSVGGLKAAASSADSGLESISSRGSPASSSAVTPRSSFRARLSHDRGVSPDDALSDCSSEDSSGPRSIESGSLASARFYANFAAAMGGSSGGFGLDRAAGAGSDVGGGLHLEWDLELRPRLPQSALISQQRGLCAGCRERLPVALGVFGGPRYCHYRCQYFCEQCHHADLRPIPARIAQRWDFEAKKVCVLAAKYLDEQATQPLFDIIRIRRTRASSQEALTAMHKLRRQFARLKALADRRSCAFLGWMVSNVAEDLPPHMAASHELYTMQDLMLLHHRGAGAMAFQTLQRLVSAGMDHVAGCQMCSADARYCCICASGKPLFTFEVDNYQTCPGCCIVYHKLCWDRAGGECPHCFAPRSSQGAHRHISEVRPR
eukprot:TRINITY_DN16383_c0_g1_i3.p1 TRINITY_DN16383_c0_g1~~TRINITY_DN16383_c0_g1_i3.p1  ORF type:complete len:1205 (+),score=296.63 TRINITY_DN16383_c0_g1_i3:92-3706(+)